MYYGRVGHNYYGVQHGMVFKSTGLFICEFTTLILQLPLVFVFHCGKDKNSKTILETTYQIE